MTIRFDGRVAIVTGAGGGLGRAYALALAARGAKLVVNDVGGARDGSGSSDAAERVAAEIRAAGGAAMASAASVTDEAAVAAMVAAAEAEWGRVDILVNNAGILRDRSFANMTIEDFRAVIEVHLIGAAIATRAVWPGMRARGYGRVLMATSSSGLYGNFGQANYAAAKLGLVGLAKTLHLEGAKHGIRVNLLAPVAATRMTAELIPADAAAALTPEAIVPAVLFLLSDEAPSGAILGTGAGVHHAAYVTMTPGVALPADLSPEAIAAHWPAIADRTDELVPGSGGEHMMALLARLG